MKQKGKDTKGLTIREISAVLLAGGASTRYGGRIKAKSLIGGEKIIDRALRLIKNVFDEIIIVTNTPEEFTEYYGLILTTDHFRGAGPLGGIHAAMKVSSRKAVFVFAGDMPFLNSKLILDQITYAGDNHADAIIPEVNGKVEPLHGIYMNYLITDLESHLSSGKDKALRSFLQTINVTFYRPDISDEVIKAFVNINSPGDARKYS
ncbi:MAG: molybdenum cofactor guanylyltransferase [Bacteroidales bacterium]|jgi:molybdopterin-guanine dinucleotide biosynthesis protein A